jgi:secreted Zn-dependent insulinase-like peptidase
MASAGGKLRELYQKQGEITAKGAEGIDSTLTAEQLTRWREHKFLSPMLAPYEKLDLSEAQLAKISAEFNRSVTAAKPEDLLFQLPYPLQMKLHQLIEKEILNDEQRQKLVLDTILAQYKAVDLTEAQVAKIKDQAITLVKGAKPEDTMRSISITLGNFVQKEVLTDEQRGKALLGPMLAYYKKAELTDEQLAKIKDKLKELMKETKPEDMAGMYAVYPKLSNFIQTQVLTDEQRSTVMLDPMLTMFKKAELTDEQVGKIKDKFKELNKEAKAADAPWGAAPKIYPFIIKEVLTDDQRTKMGIKAPK